MVGSIINCSGSEDAKTQRFSNLPRVTWNASCFQLCLAGCPRLITVFCLAKRIVLLGEDYLGIVEPSSVLKNSFLVVMLIASQAMWVLNCGPCQILSSKQLS